MRESYTVSINQCLWKTQKISGLIQILYLKCQMSLYYAEVLQMARHMFQLS